MAITEILAAYDSAEFGAEHRLGMTIAPDDPDRPLVLGWAAGTGEPILDVGSGTGRWAGLLDEHGHEVVGIEPAGRLLAMARQAHPDIEFHQALVDDLPVLGRRFGAVLAWYSLIHMGPDELLTALTILRSVTIDGGGLLVSFYGGPRAETMNHPATTAYRWPLDEITAIAEKAGYTVTESHWYRPGTAAYLIAVAGDGASDDNEAGLDAPIGAAVQPAGLDTPIGSRPGAAPPAQSDADARWAGPDRGSLPDW